MRLAFALAGALLISGCVTGSSIDREVAAARRKAQPSAAEVADCKAQGGSIQGVGMFGMPSCVIPYADGGKVCSDDTDCQGRCIVELGHPGEPDLKPGDALTGQCQKDTALFGCYAEIVGGKVEHSICVD